MFRLFDAADKNAEGTMSKAECEAFAETVAAKLTKEQQAESPLKPEQCQDLTREQWGGVADLVIKGFENTPPAMAEKVVDEMEKVVDEITSSSSQSIALLAICLTVMMRLL